MIAINMTFFDKHGVFEKIPAMSTSMAIAVVVIFSVAIVGMLGMVAYLLMRPAGAAEAERKAKLGINEGAFALFLQLILWIFFRHRLTSILCLFLRSRDPRVGRAYQSRGSEL
jgi:hypothetical protein